MSDKDFKVKNKLVVNGLTGGAGPLVANSNKEIDSVAYLTTLQGGTGTTTSPSAGQVLYSAGGTTYNPTTLNTLDVKGATYSADAPSSPVIGQIWVESDTSSDSFDPNIIRRKTFTATANQTVFTTDLEFIQGYEQVFFNGMLLIRNSDYTTASNTNVTLAAGAAAGDIIEVVSITNLNSINAATTTTNTFTGNQGVGGDPLFPIHQIGIVAPNITSDTYLSTGGPAYLGRRARGTIASPSAVQAGDGLNAFIARGYGSTGFGANNVAAVLLTAEENFTDTSQPTYIAFGTTGSGLITRSERMRIASNGNVGINNTNPTATLDVNGAITARAQIGSFNWMGDIDTAKWSSKLGGYNLSFGNDGTNYTGFETWVIDGRTFRSSIQFTNSGGINLAGDYVIRTINSTSSVKKFSRTDDNLTTELSSISMFGAGANNFNGVISFNTKSGGFFDSPLAEAMRVDTSRYLLIGYTSSNGAYRLQVNSQIFATSSSIATSDGRYKENVDTIISGLNIVDSLRPVSFTWKDHPVHNFVAGKTVGFIAQEVQEALSEYDWVDNIIKSNMSEAVLDEEGNEVTPAEEFLGIAEANIIPLLVAAVKELKARLETLEAK